VALAQGGQVRADFLAATDACTTAAALREAVAEVEDTVPTETPDGLTICCAYEQTGALFALWSPRAWTTTYGAPGTACTWISRSAAGELSQWRSVGSALTPKHGGWLAWAPR
jgi:hypothetical protein